MTGHTEQPEPAEAKRRSAAVSKAEKLVRRLGFRTVPARSGWWYHDDLGPERSFPLTLTHSPVENVGEVLGIVFDHGHAHGQAQVQRLIRQAAGL